MMEGPNIIPGGTIEEDNLPEREKFLIEEIAKRDQKIKDLTELFVVVGHDLRTPFNSILGMSEMLLKDVENMSESEIQKSAALINKSSLRAHELSKELVLWGKSQLSGIEVNKQIFDLYPRVTNIIELAESQIKDKKITITNNIEQKQSVFADATILNVVIRNVISNAIKFAHEGGNISISIKDNKIIISDDGIGISKDRLINFFDKVGHTAPGTNREKGTGLGMNMCKSFMEEMKGEIAVESEEGEGSTFTVTLPTENQEIKN